MGFFGTFVYSDGTWGDRATTGEYLSLDIHDSDVATVEYGPSPGGAGRFYLGNEPRHYFEDPKASQPVDAATEAQAFVAWAERVVGVSLAADDIAAMFADSEGGEPHEVFVEDTVVKLIDMLGLPLPEKLEEAN